MSATTATPTALTASQNLLVRLSAAMKCWSERRTVSMSAHTPRPTAQSWATCQIHITA